MFWWSSFCSPLLFKRGVRGESKSLPLPEREVRREWERLHPNPPLKQEEGTPPSFIQERG